MTTIRNESMDSPNESTFLRISYTNPASLLYLLLEILNNLQYLLYDLTANIFTYDDNDMKQISVRTMNFVQHFPGFNWNYF